MILIFVFIKYFNKLYTLFESLCCEEVKKIGEGVGYWKELKKQDKNILYLSQIRSPEKKRHRKRCFF